MKDKKQNGGAGAGNPDDNESNAILENGLPVDTLNSLRARLLGEDGGKGGSVNDDVDDIDDDDEPAVFDGSDENGEDDVDDQDDVSDGGGDDDQDDGSDDSDNDSDDSGDSDGGENGDGEDGKKGKPKGDAKKAAKPKDKFELRAIEKMQKRIDKKSAEIYSLREKVRQLESAREQGESKYAKTADAKLAEMVASAKNEAELDGVVEKLRGNRKYLRGLLAKDVIEIAGEDGNPVEIDRRNVIAMLEDVENAIDGNVAARREKFRAAAAEKTKREQGMKNAERAFPWFADKNSAGRKWVEETVLDPDFDSDIYTLLCYAYQGVTTNKARQAVGAQKPNGRAKPSVSAPSVSTAADESDVVRPNEDGTLDISSLINRNKGLFRNG